jgi:hypothetical protein
MTVLVITTEGKQSELGPVAKARAVFEAMQGKARKDVLEACEQLGVKRSTASTQYQRWRKARQEKEH